MPGVLKIVIGIAFIAGGLSGKLVLIGTQSGLAVAGAALVIWGVVRIAGQPRLKWVLERGVTPRAPQESLNAP